MLPGENITETDLRAVVGLMQGQGVVQVLAFGDFLLLQPAWINRYASVVVRMAREHADEMGVVLEQRGAGREAGLQGHGAPGRCG